MIAVILRSLTSKLYKLYNNKNIPDTSRLTNNWHNDVSSLLFIELPNVKDGSQVKTYSYTVHINSNVPVNIWFINILINITIILIIALNLLAFENTKLFIISTHYILFILYFRCGGGLIWKYNFHQKLTRYPVFGHILDISRIPHN